MLLLVLLLKCLYVDVKWDGDGFSERNFVFLFNILFIVTSDHYLIADSISSIVKVIKPLKIYQLHKFKQERNLFGYL